MSSTYGHALALGLGGRALGESVSRRVAYVEYVESLDELDALTVRFDVPAGPEAEDVLAVAQAGTTYSLELTTADGTLAVEGDIVEAGVTFARSGWWTVTLRGLEGLHRLRGAQAPKLWKGAPNTFFSTIAQRHGLTASAEGVDGNAPYTLQADEDDAHFVKRLARDLNYFVKVEGKELLFGRRHASSGATLTVDIADVTRLSLDTSLFDVLTKVTVVADDYTSRQRRLVKAEADGRKLKKIAGGKDAPALAKAAFGARELVVHNSLCTVPSLAQAVATAKMQRAAETLVRGSLRARAIPGAVSGRRVSVKDAPWPVTGPFLIRQTRHVVEDRVYETEIDFVSDSLPVRR